jgi:hypothetical protein
MKGSIKATISFIVAVVSLNLSATVAIAKFNNFIAFLIFLLSSILFGVSGILVVGYIEKKEKILEK